MPDTWGDYYLLLGTAAATLIGLLFVVSTLMTGREAEEVERGKKIYTSPVVWQLAGALALSGAALMPTLGPSAFAVIGSVTGLGGTLLSGWITVRIHRSDAPASTRIFDLWSYGVAATAAYALLLASSIALLMGLDWAATASGAAVMALLLVAIHNAWDLVTFLAPRADLEPTAATVSDKDKPSAKRASRSGGRRATRPKR